MYTPPLRSPVAPLAILAALASCQVSTLLQDRPGTLLSVSPALLADSALAGSDQRRVMSLSISAATGAELQWSAAVALQSGWLSLDRTSGTVPDTISVSADPAALAPGMHQDTILVSTTGEVPETLRVPVLFRLRGPPRLIFLAQPGATTAGEIITPAVRVAAVDDSGNVVAAFSSPVTLGVGSNPGTGSLSGTATVTAQSGVATFADLSIDKAGSGYTLTASAAGYADGTSQGFDVTPAAATRLAFSVQPADTRAGSVISPPVEVTAYDAFGNRVPGFTGLVTVAIGRDGSALGNARLSGTTAVAAAAGVARFADLRIDQSGSGYTLTAASGSGPAAAESASFTIRVF